MAKAPTDMVVIDKTYDLVVWSCQHIAKFPRSHRWLYALLELLLQAKYGRDRLMLLQHANLELELLRFQFRLAKDLKCLSVDRYGAASRAVNEVGKLVGGWIKQTGSQKHPAPP